MPVGESGSAQVASGAAQIIFIVRVWRRAWGGAPRTGEPGVKEVADGTGNQGGIYHTEYRR